MASGARAPEELETLFEDALIVRDREALVTLFEVGAMLIAEDGSSSTGVDAIARWALAAWDGDRVYVADPRRTTQRGDVALIVWERGVNLARRGHDGAWRYAIVVSVRECGTRRSEE